jgi:lipopolysaccharide export system protein LptA/lipopolysaccharide export system protein LptC
MERRKYIRERRRQLLAAWLRFILALGVIALAVVGVRFVWQMSAQEISKVQNRPMPDYYMVVDKPVGMTVINENGEVSMRISGKEVRLSKDQKSAEFIGAEATYYEQGTMSLEISAGNIKYNTDTEDFLLTEGLTIKTRDGMTVTAPGVEWRRNKVPVVAMPGAAAHAPSFRFRDGVEVVSRDGNTISSKYMQADRELMYMEFVGDVQGRLAKLEDTEFIEDRKLTDVGQLKLEDFEALNFDAEQVIYDKREEVVLATSRFYDRTFQVLDMDGQPVDVAAYQTAPRQVTFSKKEITIKADHLEAHLAKQWAECYGNINMVIPPAQPKAGDDRALQTMKRFTTKIATGDVEYFWGRDYVMTHGRTRVEQDDRLALADAITYWGDEKMVFLEGQVTMVQGSGDWMIDDELIQVQDHDMERAVRSYAEMSADRSVIYLNNNDFVASGNVLLRQDERETAADMIVYQDEIKRISAEGNIKFRDKDGQMLMCKSLVFHNNSDFLEVKGGASAVLRIPAKFANDINRTLANAREEPVPADITDPEIPATTPKRNPNAGSLLAGTVTPLPPPIPSGSTLPTVPKGDPPPLPLPGSPEAGAQPEENPAQELLLNLGEKPAPEPPPADEPDIEKEKEKGGKK